MKIHWILLGAGIVAGYLLCTTLVAFQPFTWIYSKSAGIS